MKKEFCRGCYVHLREKGVKLNFKIIFTKTIIGREQKRNMEEKEVGRLLGSIRREKGISLEKLCQGVCSAATLFRIEKQGLIPDVMTMERLFSRLGKSVNKVEVLLSYRDYEMYHRQVGIEQALEEECIEEAENLLQEYAQQEEMKQSVHEQYCRRMRAVVNTVKGMSAKELEEDLEKALQITLPGFATDRIDEYLLAEEEWILVFMWLEQKMIATGDETLTDCKKILRYLEKREWDEELLLRIYPKAVWLYAKQKNVNKDVIVGLCEKVIYMLIRNGVILFLPQFLELRKNILAESRTGESVAKQAREESETLKWVYEVSNVDYPVMEIPMWKTFKQNEQFLLPEVIRMERQNMGKSQEELAWDAAVDQKTLSRIETGIHVPKPTTFEKIRQSLHMYKNMYSTAIAVENFELLELKRGLNREITLKHFDRAQELFDTLCQKISADEKENRQYIAYMRTIMDLKRGIIGRQDALEKAKEAFEETRSFVLDKIAKVTLSEGEANIANFIAQMYCESGDVRKAVEILESVLAGYDSSNLSEKHHYRTISVVLLKLAYYCETEDLLESALDYCQRGLKLQFACYRCNLIRNFLQQKQCIMERMGYTEKSPVIFYCKLYSFCKLIGDNAAMVSIKKYCKKQYGIILNTEG